MIAARRAFGSMREVKAALEAQLRIESGTLTRWASRRGGTQAALALIAGFALMWWASSHLKLVDIYLFCFLVGFGFSVLAALSGSFHMHVQGVHAGATGLDAGQTPHGTSAISGLTPAPLRPCSLGLGALGLFWLNTSDLA